MDQDKVKVNKRAKNNEANFQHLDRKSAFSKGLFIIWLKGLKLLKIFSFFIHLFIYFCNNFRTSRYLHVFNEMTQTCGIGKGKSSRGGSRVTKLKINKCYTLTLFQHDTIIIIIIFLGKVDWTIHHEEITRCDVWKSLPWIFHYLPVDITFLFPRTKTRLLKG